MTKYTLKWSQDQHIYCIVYSSLPIYLVYNWVDFFQCIYLHCCRMYSFASISIGLDLLLSSLLFIRQIGACSFLLLTARLYLLNVGSSDIKLNKPDILKV